MRLGSGFLVAAALSALPLPVFAQAQPEALEAGQENTGRISVIEGDALFGRGPYDEETWELSINAILREGDEVFTEGGAFAEMELPGGTFLRLDANTTIVIQRIGEQGVEVSLAQGSVYVSRGPQARPVVVQTFGGGVELGGNSMARIGADAGRTSIEIKAVRGSAEMRTDSTAIAVPERKTLVWTREGTRSAAYDAARFDDFDRWNEDREAVVRGTSRSQHVASNAIGAYELEGNGTWVMIDGYWAWRPTVVTSGWRPYSYGYWRWSEPWGWTWVDYYSWGYTTCHYGRWYYRHAYGWVWYPDPYWSGAWVVWAAFGPHIGWAPCDFWGRPIYVYSYNSYYDYGAWCYTDSTYFYSGGGYVTRSVRTSTSRSATGGRGAVRTSIGRDGSHRIRTFDAQTIREHTPVPVRDSVSELTPRTIAQAAERGTLKGVRAGDRKGELLARAVKDGGVRPEPWAERGGRDDRGSLAPSGRGDAFGGDRAPARNPGREGWGVPGARDDADRASGSGPSLAPRGSDGWGRGASNDRGSSAPSFGGTRNDASDRGSSAPSFGGSSRGSSSDRGSSSPSWGGSSRDSSSDRGSSSPSWGGSSRGSSSSSSSQPDRGWTPPARDSGSSRGSSAPSVRTPPPRSDPPKRNDDKPKPRSFWNGDRDSGYSYSSRDTGRSKASTGGRSSWGSAPSRSSSSSKSSWSAPSRSSSSSSWSAPSRSRSSSKSYSAPSRSRSSSKSYSAPKSRSSSKSYSAPSRSSSSSKSYSAPKSRSSSKSSGSSRSSSSSSKSSSKKRGRR